MSNPDPYVSPSYEVRREHYEPKPQGVKMFRAWDKTSTDTFAVVNGFQMTFKNGHTVSVVWNDNQTRAEVARSPNYGEAGEDWTVVTPTAGPDAVAKYIKEIVEDDDVDPLGLTDDDVS